MFYITLTEAGLKQTQGPEFISHYCCKKSKKRERSIYSKSKDYRKLSAKHVKVIFHISEHISSCLEPQ
jgi:hypothetical protein